MNKDKQIEEMARLMCEGCADYGDCKYDICDATLDEAERLYNAGYRKQSGGEWKIMKMGDGEKVRTCSSCLISQSVSVYKGKVMFRYCPYCGAKMDGERKEK